MTITKRGGRGSARVFRLSGPAGRGDPLAAPCPVFALSGLTRAMEYPMSLLEPGQMRSAGTQPRRIRITLLLFSA